MHGAFHAGDLETGDVFWAMGTSAPRQDGGSIFYYEVKVAVLGSPNYKDACVGWGPASGDAGGAYIFWSHANAGNLPRAVEWQKGACLLQHVAVAVRHLFYIH